MNRDDAKRQVQQATDIVRLIGEQVALRPKGKEFAGLCPFHEDSNPSMYVSPAKQIFKCFSCGAGGDVFSFVMDYHKMSFVEALKYLADRAGIELPRHRSDAPAEASDSPTSRDAMRKASEAALRYFRRELADETSGAEARAYLQRRGVSDEMIEAFAVGYAPDGWENLTEAVKQGGGDLRTYEAVGLTGSRNDGSGFDKFRHRLIFPIFDAIGRPIAFGGRKLRDEDEPKYLNSAEHALFNKSATLFGLHLAKKPIIDSRTAVIVEGYTDVIAAHQAGFANVVATLGTALTRQHAIELRRYCDRVLLVFDADEAGQKAADRALEVFFSEPIDVAIAVLPEGLDPADLLAKDDGPKRWREAMDGATDAMAFHFARVRRSFEAVDTTTGKQRIATDYLRTLVQLGLRQLEPTRKGMVLHQVAQLLRMDVAAVDRMLRDLAGAAAAARRQAEAPAPPAEQPDTRHRVEQLLIGCLLNRPDLFHAEMPDGRPLDESILPGDVQHNATASVYSLVHEWLSQHGQFDGFDLRSMIEGEALLRHALDMKLEAERLHGEPSDGIERALRAAAEQFATIRARERYETEKHETYEDGDLETQLLQLREHVKTHKDMSRLPRPTN